MSAAPPVPPLRSFRDPQAVVRLLEVVQSASGDIVTVTGTGGRDQRLAETLGRKLERAGVQWTLDRNGDEVTLKLSDGKLPGYTGSPEPRSWSADERQTTGASFSYTNGSFTH